MNFSTTARRTALAVLTFTCLLIGHTAQGQFDCSDFDAAPASGTVVITLPLDASGDAQIDNTVLEANGFAKEFFCSYWLSLSPAGPFTSAPINFTCNPPPAVAFGGVGTYVLYVRTGGIGTITNGTPGGPGATVVSITVNVVDNIIPTIAANAGPFSRNADIGPLGSCRYTIIAGDAANFNPIAPAPSDNCLGFTVEYSIDGGSWTAGASVVGQVLNGTGAHTIQWRNRDASNNIQTLTPITINVSDLTPPSITCPGNAVRNTDLNFCTYTTSGIEFNPTVSDNCSVVNTSYT